MKVLAASAHYWFLLEHEGRLYLDANCNHSAFGYTYMIELDEAETAGYQKRGVSYLDKLPNEIQNSAPVVRGSRSRDVTAEYADLVTQAVNAWRSESEQ
jgi:hypothetical protein